MSDKHEFNWYGNNRHLCDALDDMRKCTESLNFSAIKGLIEEVQIMGNRMEAALSNQKDLNNISKDLSEARKAYRKLQKEYNALHKKTKALKAKASKGK